MASSALKLWEQMCCAVASRARDGVCLQEVVLRHPAGMEEAGLHTEIQKVEVLLSLEDE